MKLIINNLLAGCALGAALLFMSGCNSAKETKPAMRYFPRLMEYNLELTVPITRRVLKADEEITFILINNSDKQVQLLDWHVDETDNLRIFYQPYRDGIEKLDLSDKTWRVIEPEIQSPARYNPLTLSPLNRVFIYTTLKFANKPGKYLMVGKLTSGMVEVQTPVMEIEIIK